MAKQNMNDYVAHMNDVTLPPGARASLEQALEAARAEHAAASTWSPTAAANTPPAHGARRRARTERRRTARRIIAIAACSAALLLGSAALAISGFNPFTALQTAGSASTSTPFALAAYANGTPVAGSSSVVSSNELITSLGIGSWSAGDTTEAGQTYTVNWKIDLSTVGDHVASLDLSVDNDSIQLRSMDKLDPQASVKQNERTGSSLTLSGSDIKDLQLNLEIELPVEGELADAVAAYQAARAALPRDMAQWTDEDYDAFNAHNDEFSDTLNLLAAQKLAESPLTLTATLEDGSTVTHSYRFSPVENFKELLRHDETLFWEGTDEDRENFVPSALFTIEQIS